MVAVREKQGKQTISYHKEGSFMAIFFDKQQHSFFLQTPNSTYIIEIVKGRYLSHLYW